MRMDYSYNLTQEQKLILTHEMQLSIKVLQMSANELREYINDEFAENPILEMQENISNSADSKNKELDKYDYKEMIKYLDGEYTYDEAIEIIKRDSRRYAKRQLTWFKRYQDAKWFDLDKYQDIEILKEDIINHIEKLLEIV